MTKESAEQPGNAIGGGIYQAPVIQAAGDVDVSFHLQDAAPVALAQLPSGAAVFIGRGDDLAVLDGLLDPAGMVGPTRPVVVSAVAGLAGVGKTTLAVEAGHAALRKGRFGGGVLFIDLHGYDEAPMGPSQALAALLRALGVSAEHVPPTADERAGLYRSVLASIIDPVLVIADNASSEEQVRPLLPGTGPHKLLVTSRHTLAGLDARLVDVVALDEESSVGLLDAALRVARPEDDRITDDREAAALLAAFCGGLPLALQVTAAMLKQDPALTATELAGLLADETQRLATLHYDDGSGQSGLSVTAAFNLSYQRLGQNAQRVFRMAAVAPGPDASTATVALLAGTSQAAVRRILGSLARAHVIETSPGVADRWRMHDLVRLYARKKSDERAETDGRDQAIDQLLGYWLDMADAAHARIYAPPGIEPSEVWASRDEAGNWLDREWASLIAAAHMAAATGRDQTRIRE